MGMARCIFNRLAGRTIPAAFRGIVLWPVLAVLFAGCSLDDDRDLCCPGKLTMHYTYRPSGYEEFGFNIFTLRHFLFDSEGKLIGELPPGDNLQLQPLDLEAGIYTMVTLGNLSERTALGHGDDRVLSQFTLSHVGSYLDYFLTDSGLGDYSPEEEYISWTRNATRDDMLRANSDELFWGVKQFAVNADGRGMDYSRQRLKRDAEAAAEPEAAPSAHDDDEYTESFGRLQNRLVTPMNNIHCHLRVMVEWANVPDHIGDYEMELSGVPASYSLHPENASQTAGGFLVPSRGESAVHRLVVPMEQRELIGEFTTLRYDDDMIPTLRIYFGGEPVTPDIDLTKAFRTWGWIPSEIHVQEFGIRLIIYGDGSVRLSPVFEASVEDWVDGGTFG